ncbi:disulfide bond formation protein B [Rhizobium sp. LjRoot30]|uniref:disulfide bond formation protein B n=1 Tax=Rhizobium sp. LjRoot30 TaxID=3342320 RepID=UPI003ECDEA4A
MNSTTGNRTQTIASGLLALGMAATVVTALGFEHIGGFIPCMLCLLEREPYYYGIPVAAAAFLSSLLGAPAWLTRLLLAVAGIIMIVGAGMGVYHSGVEWHFWEGPTTCSTTVNAVTTNAGDLLGDLNRVKGPSCTDAAGRFLGLSFAGWNVIASVILAAIAFVGLRAKKTA